MRFIGRSAAALVAAAAVAPASAGAATAVVGQTGDPAGGQCGDSTSLLQTATSASVSYRAPSAGTVTSWSQFGGDIGGSGWLVVWRPTGNANEFTVIGKSSPETMTPNVLNTFPTSIPIAAGDYIGFTTASGGGCLVYTNNATDRLLQFTHVGDPDPVIGSPLAFTQLFDKYFVNLSATVVTPDAPQPPAPTRSVTITYRKNKAFKGAVTSSDPACLRAATAVFRKKPGKDKRIGKDETNASGRWKVSEHDADKGKYYASVKAEGSCPAATSNSVRVR